MSPASRRKPPLSRRQRLRAIADQALADTHEETGSAKGDLGRFLRTYLSPYRGTVTLIFLTMLLWALVPFGFPLTHRHLIDNVLGAATADAVADLDITVLAGGVWLIFWLNMGLHSMNMICHVVVSYLSLQVGQKTAFVLRKDLYLKLDSLHLGYHERTQTGRTISRVQDDVAVIQDAFANQLKFALVEPFKLAVGLGFMLYLNWRLTFIVILALPLYALATVFFRPFIQRNTKARRRLNSRMYGLAAERLGAIHLVKAFGQERRELFRFSRLVFDGVRLTLQNPLYTQGLSLIVGTITSVVTGLLMWRGLLAVRDELFGMTLGGILAYLQLTAYVFMPIQVMTDMAGVLQQALICLRRVFSVLDQPVEVRPGRIRLTGRQGRIEFDHVNFAYPDQAQPALRNVSFSILHGERVAIMGPSGGGKTTLFQLLMRFYDPQLGAIRVGGVDLAQTDPASVRRHVRLVQQESFIFSGTLHENIAYGYPEATPGQIIQATRQAELHEFVLSLPAKYETEVGERGVSLSGGQKQRLALATALVTDPEILLLDDTTSALDAQTEARIRATLNKALEGRTSLVVTQRIATARECDRIIVLENGRVTQVGTHASLMATDGFYQSIARQQENPDGTL